MAIQRGCGRSVAFHHVDMGGAPLPMEVVAWRQAYPRLLDQCDAGAASRLVRRGPRATLRPVSNSRHPAARRRAVLSKRSPRRTAVSKQAVSRASSSCARTSRCGVDGRRSCSTLPNWDSFLGLYSYPEAGMIVRMRRSCVLRDGNCLFVRRARISYRPLAIERHCALSR